MILVEHTDPEGPSIALWLAARGHQVALVGGRQPEPTEKAELDRLGVTLSDRWTGHTGAQQALLDVWTSETDERVAQLRSQGVKTSCLADWILQHSPEQVVAITGTAGKTTTSWLVQQLLEGLGATVVCGQARAGNLWPTSALLQRPAQALVVAELTSSHLAFCHHSPHIAAVTNFWPDHIELHGSLQAYRAAKERLFRWQSRSDIAVLPADDEEAASLAQASPAQRAWFAQDARPAGEGLKVWSSGGSVLLEREGCWEFSIPPHLAPPTRLRALLCALTASLAAAPPLPADQVAACLNSLLPDLRLPPHRATPGQGLLDDTLAATPSKASANLEPGTCLVAGGLLEIAGRRVHHSPAEQAGLERWLQRIRTTCQSVDLFGPAGLWLSQRLAGVPGQTHDHVQQAIQAARQRAGPGGRVLVAPGFPMLQSDREIVAVICGSASALRRAW